MVSFENVAREFLGDKVHVVIPPREDFKDEWEFDLLLTEGDKLTLIDALRRMESEPAKSKEILKQQDDLVRNILIASYPDMDKKAIDSAVLHRSTEILLELSFKFGIRDRNAYNALLAKQKSEIKKMQGDESQPEKEAE